MFKTILTLLATLTLLLVQGGLVSSASLPTVKKMNCCGDQCPTHCCVGENSPGPAEPLPAIPAAPSSQLLQADLLPVLISLISGEQSGSLAPHFTHPTPAPGSPVPLYLRTHSFLI